MLQYWVGCYHGLYDNVLHGGKKTNIIELLMNRQLGGRRGDREREKGVRGGGGERERETERDGKP